MNFGSVLEQVYSVGLDPTGRHAHAGSIPVTLILVDTLAKTNNRVYRDLRKIAIVNFASVVELVYTGGSKSPERKLTQVRSLSLVQNKV